jgi:AcrR family transcriptional regulator
MGIAERKERERNLQQKMRRRQILDAAKRVFHIKGFGSATMENIAREAELSPGTIYLYFKDKDDLYASLNLQLLDYLSDRLERLNGEKDLNAEGKLQALKDLLYDVFNFDKLILINLFHLQASKDLKNLSPERSRQLNKLAAKCLRSIAKIFEQGIAEGRFIDYKPIALGDIIWIIFTGTVLWEKSKNMTDPRKDYLKQTLDLAIDIFSRGIKAT